MGKIGRRATVRVKRTPVDRDTMGVKVTPVRAVRRPIRRKNK